ncbi:flagella synthesis protein FlgN [Rhodanobacter lindaniclasticus]
MRQPLQHELNDALASVLDEMQQRADQLQSTLEAERAALDRADAEALDAAGNHKQALMQQLEQLDAERQSLLREQPVGDAVRASRWAQVLQVLRHCHALNQRNGSLVNQRLAQLRQALAILTGHAGEGDLYGSGGELHGSLRSKSLAAA